MVSKQWYCTMLRQESGQEVQENISRALKSSDQIQNQKGKKR